MSVSPAGSISSPDFGNNQTYNTSLECVWTIENQQALGSTVLFNFTNLDIERHGDCLWDFVEFREGE